MTSLLVSFALLLSPPIELRPAPIDTTRQRCIPKETDTTVTEWIGLRFKVRDTVLAGRRLKSIRSALGKLAEKAVKSLPRPNSTIRFDGETGWFEPETKRFREGWRFKGPVNRGTFWLTPRGLTSLDPDSGGSRSLDSILIAGLASA